MNTATPTAPTFTPTQRDRWPAKITDPLAGRTGPARTIFVVWSDGLNETVETTDPCAWLQSTGFDARDYEVLPTKDPHTRRVVHVPGVNEPGWVAEWFRRQRFAAQAAADVFAEQSRGLMAKATEDALRCSGHAVDSLREVTVTPYTNMATAFRPWLHTKRVHGWTGRRPGAGIDFDYLTCADTGAIVAVSRVHRDGAEPPAHWVWAQDCGYEMVATPDGTQPPQNDQYSYLDERAEWWTVLAS
jgi:hypothetical protein